MNSNNYTNINNIFGSSELKFMNPDKKINRRVVHINETVLRQLKAKGDLMQYLANAGFDMSKAINHEDDYLNNNSIRYWQDYVEKKEKKNKQEPNLLKTPQDLLELYKNPIMFGGYEKLGEEYGRYFEKILEEMKNDKKQKPKSKPQSIQVPTPTPTPQPPVELDFFKGDSLIKSVD